MEIEIPEWMGRTQLLLGEEKLRRLLKAHVLVAGLGGVGGICAEMLVRAGIGEISIVDADTVDPTNRNRQIPALATNHGEMKAEVMAKRLMDINPELIIHVIPEFMDKSNMDNILNLYPYTYICDCIDTLSAKVYFIIGAKERKIPIVSSMGAGGKVDPTKLEVTDISKTFNCHLAHDVRKYLRRRGVYRGVKAVFSSEMHQQYMVKATPEMTFKKSIIGTISYLPAVFGCTVASVAIRDIYDNFPKTPKPKRNN